MPIDDSLPFHPLRIAVVTVSDTRTPETDRSGALLVSRLEAAGHHLAERTIVPDDQPTLERTFRALAARDNVDCILSTGGTGVTARDVTPEAVERVADKIIPGFGELFRMLSYETIGTSTIQSRAIGAIVNGTCLFALPGSEGAVRDGWDMILVTQLDSRFRPCNFVDLLPRLR